MACQITVLINAKSISIVYFYKKDKLKLINGDSINEVTTGVKYWKLGIHIQFPRH